MLKIAKDAIKRCVPALHKRWNKMGITIIIYLQPTKTDEFIEDNNYALRIVGMYIIWRTVCIIYDYSNERFSKKNITLLVSCSLAKLHSPLSQSGRGLNNNYVCNDRSMYLPVRTVFVTYHAKFMYGGDNRVYSWIPIETIPLIRLL